jgi:hypothetical protein
MEKADPVGLFFDDPWDHSTEENPFVDMGDPRGEESAAIPASNLPNGLSTQVEVDIPAPSDRSSGFVLPAYQMMAPHPILNQKAEDSDTHMITVILRSTHDRNRDVRRMKSVQGLMQSVPGRDHFTFHIIEDGRRCLIEFPNHTTGITPELLNRLEKLVGKANYRVDPIILQ